MLHACAVVAGGIVAGRRGADVVRARLRGGAIRRGTRGGPGAELRSEVNNFEK